MTLYLAARVLFWLAVGGAVGFTYSFGWLLER